MLSEAGFRLRSTISRTKLRLRSARTPLEALREVRALGILRRGILTLLETGLQENVLALPRPCLPFSFNPHSIGDWFTSECVQRKDTLGCKVSILTLLETGLQGKMIALLFA